MSSKASALSIFNNKWKLFRYILHTKDIKRTLRLQNQTFKSQEMTEFISPLVHKHYDSFSQQHTVSLHRSHIKL